MKTIYNNKNSYKEALKVPLSNENNLANKTSNKNRHFINKEDELFIDDIFTGDKFYNFRRFCRINKYKLLGSLDKDVIKQFESTKGVGIGKIDAIIHKLENVYSDKEYILNKFCHFNNVNFSNENQEIIHVFWQDKYNKFREFCKKNKINYIGEIDNNVLAKFKNIKGIGQGKVQDIINVLTTYAVENSYENDGVFNSGRIYNFVNDLSLAKLGNIFQIKNNLDNILIKDIEGKNVNEIKGISKHDLKRLMKKLNLLKTPKEIIENFEISLSDRTKDILFLRYYKSKTLQDIANKYDLTRERVRQIISIAINSLNSIIITEDFTASIKIYIGYTDYIDYDEFINAIGKDKIYIANILIKEEVIKYSKELKKILLYKFK